MSTPNDPVDPTPETGAPPASEGQAPQAPSLDDLQPAAPSSEAAAAEPSEGVSPAPTPPTLVERVRQTAIAEWRALIGVGDPTRKPLALRAWRRLSRALRSPDVRPREKTLRAPRPLWRRAIVATGWVFAVFALLFGGFFAYVTAGMPSTRDLWTANDAPSLTFVDRRGRVILREGAQNAPPVDLSTLPDYVPQAVLAIEDKRFYQHLGVDFEGLSRALVENLEAGRVVQGGSTITQQLAKNLFLTNERTFRRKAQEIALALWLERRFTKDEILALYLSRVYFGAGAWGVEAASERYFDKPARELTLSEAALLAALLKAPSRLNPAQDPAAAGERRAVVLAEMVQEGYISPEERAAADAIPVVVSRANPVGDLGYFRAWIDPFLNEVIGEQRDDFIVETTLDLEAQRAGERAVDQRLAEQGDALNASQAALLSLASDGGVLAMVGGRGFSDSQFNRATQMRRQPGSAFKYFIFLAAMENGYSPETVRVDRPITIGDWRPGNYNEEYRGAVTLTAAYALSLNMVAIQVANEIGGDVVIETARRLGVRSRLENYRSLALGAQEMTLSELTAAYGAMANGGYRMDPFGVLRVRRASGEVVYERRSDPVRVIDESALRLMNVLMKRVVDAGTGARAKLEGREVGGKTGTGNEYRDTWFVGYTPGMVSGVWVGNDDFTPTRRVTGGALAAEIWRQYMQVAARSLKPEPLPMPRPEDYPPIQPPPLLVDAPETEPLAPLSPGPPMGELEEIPLPSG